MNNETQHSLMIGVLVVALTGAASFLGSQDLQYQRGRLYAFAGLVVGWILTAVFFALGLLAPSELLLLGCAQFGALGSTLCRLRTIKR